MHVRQRHHLTTIDADGRRYDVSLVIAWDGIEYVGRLWFADEATSQVGIPDRGAIPGLTKDEVLTRAKRLHPDDLARRYQGALAEKRRYHALRRATEEMLSRVRYLNQVSISMRAGLLDADGAAQEIALVEEQLHEIVGQLKTVAARED